MHVYHTLLLTVVGPLLAAANERGLLRLGFLREVYEYPTQINALAKQWGDDVTLSPDQAPFFPLITQLGEYFCGRRRQFDIPLDLRGSRFQLAVWRRLRAIPFGKLRSYRQIAKESGYPQAARAVGQATGQNPIIIVVPCHRVVGADGKLVGFGGGIHLKAQLLRLEGHTLGDTARIVAPRLF
jgi:O-6-methylguanine DNA methyltransferase